MTNTSYDELDDIYQEVILDHYRNPRNQGDLLNPDLQSRGFNPFCGDEVVLGLELDTNGIVNNVGFTGQGCSISQAAASILTDLVQGKNLDQIVQLSQRFRELMRGQELEDNELDQMGDLEALQGVRNFPIRIKCALLAWATLEDSISEYRSTSL
ncbi:SUF system NifU family Fe-S cluster assembly protein [SAR202 cluster bacterium AD-804-J14_MRT_500m]|nr:SUF system NifU family Fe-S cluster assembly protein [SAR202 cluster bacterium AD-804-J14_MRT_500m]